MKTKLPKTISPVALENILARQVHAGSDALIDCFAELMEEDYEPSVESMGICAHSPVESDTAGPRFWRYLEGANKLITNKKSGNFAGDARKLKFQFNNLMIVEREDFYDLAYADVLGKIISNWTYDCWLKAGGWFFRIPTTFYPYSEPGFGPTIQLTKLKATTK